MKQLKPQINLNLNQVKAAQTAMLGWLSGPDALGKAPARLEYGGVFTLYEKKYYIFRFKKENAPLSKWLLAVCGGFEPNAMDPDGVVTSEMGEYDPAGATDAATQLVEKIVAA